MNIGAGETFKAYLIKKENVTEVENMLSTSAQTPIVVPYEYGKVFKYRYLTSNEMTFAPISNHLKGVFDRVIYTSETEIEPRANDKIYFTDGILKDKMLIITKASPQVQLGMFLINKKPPFILELR